MINNREFLKECEYCIITPDLEEVLMRRLNANNKKELWLALNEHGYFINHFQDASGRYMHEIIPFSKRAKQKYAKLKNQK